MTDDYGWKRLAAGMRTTTPVCFVCREPTKEWINSGKWKPFYCHHGECEAIYLLDDEAAMQDHMRHRTGDVVAEWDPEVAKGMGRKGTHE